jgi:nicotinamidase-related amidase
LIDVQDCLTREYFEYMLPYMGIDIKTIPDVLNELHDYVTETFANIEKVLNGCRAKGIRPIHVKIEALLPDAADTGRLHKSAGMLTPPGSKGSFFAPESTPAEGEIVLTKTCSGIHVGTQIDRILRNLGIKNVFVVGFYTDQCISTSVRDLSDLGYATEIIEDAIGALSRERHEKALQGIQRIYAHSETTAQLLERLSKM